MKRSQLRGFPYDVGMQGANLVLRFYPKPTAKDPDAAVPRLTLGREEQRELLRILVDNL